jgi:hypothetical protein
LRVLKAQALESVLAQAQLLHAVNVSHRAMGAGGALQTLLKRVQRHVDTAISRLGTDARCIHAQRMVGTARGMARCLDSASFIFFLHKLKNWCILQGFADRSKANKKASDAWVS